MKFTALVAIIEDKDEEVAIDIAKEAGAGGVTIIHGKNIGLEEKKVFFGLTLEENVSILLFILPRKLSMKVMKAIRKELNLDSSTNGGLIFTLPLSHVAGLDINELHKFEHDIKSMI
ncbi:MAG: transcriptional regulator [Sulfurovum sp.]|nr:MAG: transcriptional regulator [Sulfurovum sp.]